jgi:HD-like signal output (HDOD) protein
MNTSSLPPPPDLVVVIINTRLKETYRFPDMTRREIERVIAEDWALPTGTLTLVNISQACLVLPIRIIAEVFVDGVKKWSAP